MIRASIGSVPPIRRRPGAEVVRFRKPSPRCAARYPQRRRQFCLLGLHFALAMSHHTIREKAINEVLGEGPMRTPRRWTPSSIAWFRFGGSRLTAARAPARKAPSAAEQCHMAGLTQQDL